MSPNISEYVNFKRSESTELQCSETTGNHFEKRMPGDKETHNIINIVTDGASIVDTTGAIYMLRIMSGKFYTKKNVSDYLSVY